MKIKDILHLPSIEIGDEILVGKFKNRRATVTGFGVDEHNQPVLKTTKGDQKLFKPRIVKLTEPEESVDENFKDGKVKGKSRPGRVKKAGASCDGSVTELRKKAKNSSGEKAKMYHWCANMKSGRKK